MRVARIVAKLTAFVTGCVLSAVLVVNTLTDPLTGDTATYHAVFTDAHGLYPGSDVTVAGVRVGTVRELELRDGHAHVTFDVRTDQRIPVDTRAIIRYADLLGSRYLALTEGSNTRSAELEPGATIPVDRTRPALDLTALFNGFKPLFAAIDPGQVNELAGNLVAVFQGERGTLDALLAKVISLASTVDSREQVLGQVLDNLTAAIGTMTHHDEDLRALVSSLAQLTSYAAGHRGEIATALDSGAELAGSLTELLGDIEPHLTEDIRSLRSLSGTLVANTDAFDALVKGAPAFLDTLGRATDYGSWVNVYVCNLRVNVVGGEPVNLSPGPHSEVCR